jgi:hypothetical protein
LAARRERGVKNEASMAAAQEDGRPPDQARERIGKRVFGCKTKQNFRRDLDEG